MASAWTTPPGGDVVLYDGHCRLCRASAEALRRLLGDRAQLRSFRDEGALAPFPGVTLAKCERALQYVRMDGRVFEGAEAVVRALGRRWYGKAAYVYFVPGLRQLADAIYRLIARYRFRWAGPACDDGCALHRK